jgi:hypothetical protein
MLETSKTTYHSGELIQVTTILKYTGTLTVTMPDAGQWYKLHYYHFDIKLPFPPWMPFAPRAAPTEFGKEQIRSAASWISEKYRRVQQDHEYRETFDLSRLYQMEQPGDYRVRVWRPIWSNDGTGVGVAASDEITITVLPE